MTGHRLRGPILRVLVATMLVIDAVVHISLAPDYQLAAPGGIGQGNLFYLEAAAAIAAALYVLFRGSRSAFLAALIVAGGGLAAVVLYRYVDLPAFGPIPAMYEPIWFPEKVLSAAVQGVGAVLAIAGLRHARRGARPIRTLSPVAGHDGAHGASSGEPLPTPPRLDSQTPPSRRGKGKD